MRTHWFVLAMAVTSAGSFAQVAELLESRRSAATFEERGAMPLNGENVCIDAVEITGYATWAFSFVSATTDGVAHTSCLNAGSTQVWRDRWWKWIAPASGSVTIDTCGQSAANTRMAVYRPAAQCPPADEYLLACVDDVCSNQPSVTFLAIEGQSYLIRIGLTGVAEPAASGTGTFTISGPPGPDFCPDNPGTCQAVDLSIDSFQSNPFFRLADDFSVVEDRAIVGLCWWGSYFQDIADHDEFVVTYWTNSAGRPGSPIASFSQQSGLDFRRIPTNDEDFQGKVIFQYAATHSPLELATNATYWLEVRNFADGVWRWQGGDKGGNGSLQDGSPASNWVGSIPRDDVAWCLQLQVDCPYDTNGDGFLDFADLNNIVSSYNTACP